MKPDNSLLEFAYLYRTLTDRQKAVVHRAIFAIFAKKAIQSPTPDNIATAGKTFFALVWPDIWRPALLALLCIMAAGLWFYTVWSTAQ